MPSQEPSCVLYLEPIALLPVSRERYLGGVRAVQNIDNILVCAMSFFAPYISLTSFLQQPLWTGLVYWKSGWDHSSVFTLLATNKGYHWGKGILVSFHGLGALLIMLSSCHRNILSCPMLPKVLKERFVEFGWFHPMLNILMLLRRPLLVLTSHCLCDVNATYVMFCFRTTLMDWRSESSGTLHIDPC